MPEMTIEEADDIISRLGAPSRDARFSGVYAIQGAGLVKIGIAVNAIERFNALGKCSPVALTPLGIILIPNRSECFQREQVIHGLFSVCRQHGEWFTATPELLAYIAEHFQAWPTHRPLRLSLAVAPYAAS